MGDGKVAGTCGSEVGRNPGSSIKHSAENQGPRVITGGGMYPERRQGPRGNEKRGRKGKEMGANGEGGGQRS